VLLLQREVGFITFRLDRLHTARGELPQYSGRLHDQALLTWALATLATVRA